MLVIIYGLQIRVPRFDSESRLQYSCGFPAFSEFLLLRKTLLASQNTKSALLREGFFVLHILYVITVFIMLTYRQLKEIQEGHRRNPDVMDLLREVKRLRAVAVLSYSVVGSIRLCDLTKEDQAKFEPLFEAL